MGRIIFKISRFLVKVLQIKRWKRASPLLHLTGASSRASKQMDMASWAGSEGESAPFLVRGCNQFCPSPVNLKGADLPRPGSPEQTKKQNWRAKPDRDGWETKESWAVLADQGGNVGTKRVNLKQRKNLDMGSSFDGAEPGYGYGYRLSTSSVGSSFEGCSAAWERENSSFSSEDPFQESREEFVVPFLKQKSEKRNLAAKCRSRNRGFASSPAVWNQMVDSEEMGSSSSSRSARWSQDFGADCPFSFPRSSANLVDPCEQYKMLESMSKSWKGSAGVGEPECNKFSAPDEQIHHRKGARKEKLNSDGFSRFKKEAMAEKKMSNNCPCHGQTETETEDLFYSGEEKTSDLRPDLSQSRVIKESFPEVRYSYNPYEDFRESMVEMIVEKELGHDGELRDLLLCFLSLNSPKYQNLIIAAFADAIAELSSLPKGMMT